MELAEVEIIASEILSGQVVGLALFSPQNILQKSDPI